MGTTYPPDGWEAAGGAVWGTDVDQNTAVLKVGTYSLEFKNTVPASNPYLYYDYMPCEPNRVYRITAWARQDDITAGNNVKVYLRLYTSAKAFIAKQTVHNTTLAAVDTWYRISGVVTAGSSTAALMRIEIGKDNTAAPNNYTVYFAGIQIEEYPASFRAQLSGNQSINDTTATVVQFATQDFDHGSVYDPANYCFEAAEDGLYSFSSGVIYSSAGDGDLLTLYFERDTGGGYTAWGDLDSKTPGGLNNASLHISVIKEELNRGDKIRVSTYQSSGGALTISDSYYTRFSGSQDL